MNSGEWTRVKELFEGALLIAASQREEWIAARCVDEGIRQEVRSLLSVYEEEPGFLEDGTAQGVGELLSDALAHQPAGVRIGPHRLGREIGRGGMGAVYEAEREGDFSQRVAIKLVRPEWNSASMADRFRYERRILARLEHPVSGTCSSRRRSQARHLVSFCFSTPPQDFGGIRIAARISTPGW